DPEVTLMAASALLSGVSPAAWEQQARLARELIELPREGAGDQTLSVYLQFVGVCLLGACDRATAERVGRELRERGERTHNAQMLVHADYYDALLALVDGRLEESLTRCRALVTRADEQ